MVSPAETVFMSSASGSCSPCGVGVGSSTVPSLPACGIPAIHLSLSLLQNEDFKLHVKEDKFPHAPLDPS